MLKPVYILFLLLYILPAATSNAFNARWDWSHPFNGKGDEIVRKVLTDDNGNIYAWTIAGRDSVTSGALVYPQLAYRNPYRMILTKYDPQGMVVQQLHLHLPLPDTVSSDYYLDIGDFVVDKEENIYISGRTLYSKVQLNNTLIIDTALQGYKHFIIKVDKNNVLQWKQIARTSNTLMDEPSLLALDNHNHLYVFANTMASYYSSNIGFPNFPITTNSISTQDVFYLAKLNRRTGAVAWCKNSYYGSHTTLNQLVVDNDNNIYLSYQGNGFDLNGAFQNIYATSVSSRVLVKLDSNASFIWGNCFSPGPALSSLQTDRDNNIYACGAFANGSDTLHILGRDYLVNSRRAENLDASFVVALSPDGTTRWKEVFNYNHVTYPSSALTTDESKNVYFTVQFNGRLFVQSDTVISNPNYKNLLTVLQLDSTGLYKGYQTTGYITQAASWGNSLASDGSGNVYIGGRYFTDNNNLGNTAIILGDSTYYSQGGQDGYIVKLHTAPLIDILQVSSLDICNGDSIRVVFRYQDTMFSPATVFALHLSDANGVFINPHILGTRPYKAGGLDTFYIKPERTLSAPAQFRLKVTAAHHRSLPYKEPLQISPLPAKPSITADGNRLSCSISNVSYQWLLNGTPIPGATQQWYDAVTAGIYRVVVTNTGGCSNSSDDLDFTPSSIADPLSHRLHISPNPVSDRLYLHGNENFSKSTISIYNISGQRLPGIPVNTDQSLDVSTLQPGVYFIEIENKGLKLRGKFIKS